MAAEFPPVNTTGNFRAARFVQHLPEHGINPIVLTINEEDSSRLFGRPINHALLKNLPEGLTVLRYPLSIHESSNKLAFFIRNFFRLSENIGHKFLETIEPHLPKIIDEHKIKAVYVSCPPFSMGDTAYAIATRFHLPLIVDMRDAWAQWTTNPHKTYFHYALKLQREKKWFSKASVIIGATGELTEVFRKSHPGVDENKFQTIYNGFNEQTEQAPVQVRLPEEGKKFHIGYVGSFYYSPVDREMMFRKWWRRPLHKMFEYRPSMEDWLYRSPYFLLETIRQMKEEDKKLAQTIHIDFVGDKPDWLEQMVRNAGLEEQVTYHGFLNRQQLLEVQHSFDALLATSEKVVGGSHYCLPSKLFDYVSANKPIFAFVTEGEQKRFLELSGIAILFDPDDVKGSAKKLSEVLREGRTLTPPPSFRSAFTGSHLAGQLATFLRESIGKNQGNRP